MILAMSKKGSKGKRSALTRKRTRGKSLEHPRSLQSNHTSMVRLPTYLGGNTGGYFSCNRLKSPSVIAYKKFDGGQKLRATRSERIRAKRRYLPPTPSTLYRGTPLKIILKPTGDTYDLY